MIISTIIVQHFSFFIGVSYAALSSPSVRPSVLLSLTRLAATYLFPQTQWKVIEL